MVVLAWGRSHRTSTDAELIRWGRAFARRRGPTSARRCELEVALVVRRRRRRRARKRIKVNGVPRRASALLGTSCASCCSRRRRCSSSPARRRCAGHRSTAWLPAGRPPRRRPGHLWAGAPAAQRPAAGHPRGARRTATSCGSGTPTLSRPAAPSWPSGWRARRDLAEPLAAAHREIAPGRGRAGCAPVRDERAADAGRDARDALPRRLAETAEKELWNGATLVGPAPRRSRVRARRPRPGGVRLAWPAADRDPGAQARRARPAHRARRPTAAAPPRRCLQRARSRRAGAPGPADRGAAAGIRDDDDARRPRPGAAGGRGGWA